ncbi:MAG: S9 family peptidase, partial [Chloroflexota bacterium]
APAGAGGLASPRYDGDTVYWTQTRPLEQGRTALLRRTADGRIEDVVPAPFSVRTRVHAETVKTTLEAHLYFLSRIFGFTPGDRLPPVEIENF